MAWSSIIQIKLLQIELINPFTPLSPGSSLTPKLYQLWFHFHKHLEGKKNGHLTRPLLRHRCACDMYACLSTVKHHHHTHRTKTPTCLSESAASACSRTISLSSTEGLSSAPPRSLTSNLSVKPGKAPCRKRSIARDVWQAEYVAGVMI